MSNERLVPFVCGLPMQTSLDLKAQEKMNPLVVLCVTLLA